jgi:hypothetical protein
MLPQSESVDRMTRGLQEIADRLRTEKNIFSEVSNSIAGSAEVFSQWLEEAREARRREQDGQYFSVSSFPLHKVTCDSKFFCCLQAQLPSRSLFSSPSCHKKHRTRAAVT